MPRPIGICGSRLSSRNPQSFAESAEEHRATPIELAAARLRQADDASFVLGAFLSGELVGMAGFFREKHLKARHKGRIWGVYVRVNYRGQGIGRALFSALLEKDQDPARFRAG